MKDNNVDSASYHLNVLASLMQGDSSLAMASDLLIDAPHEIESITKDWVQDVIGGTVQGAELERFQVATQHDGMTSRQSFVVTWNRIGTEAGLPKSLFAKATPPNPEHRIMLSILHMAEMEANFYKVLQPELGDLAPRAFYAESYVGGRHLIVLEDLTESGCTPFWTKDECGIDHVFAGAKALAKLHARYWDSERLHGDLSWLRPRTRRFGIQWLSDMTHDVRKTYLEKAGADILPPKLRELVSLWDENCDAVYESFESLPQTVLHGDCHLGNSFCSPDGSAGFFDWQVMYRGNGFRDLAYFCMTAMSSSERVSHERKVVDTYVESLRDQGVEQDMDEAWNLYCLFTLEVWDATITTWAHGSYGHGGKGRMFQTITESLLGNAVQSRLELLLETI